MKPQAISILLCLLTLVLPSRAADRVIYEGTSGPGVGKQIVFLTGDEEYRSEEGLPQMAKILATRHGFKCTVLFAINPADGTINPDIRNSLPGAEAYFHAQPISRMAGCNHETFCGCLSSGEANHRITH